MSPFDQATREQIRGAVVYTFDTKGRLFLEVPNHGRQISTLLLWQLRQPKLEDTFSRYRVRQNMEFSVVMNRQRVMFQRDGLLVAKGGWVKDAYYIDVHVVVTRVPAKFNITTASETLQVWHEPLGHQAKRHVRTFAGKGRNQHEHGRNGRIL